MTADRHGPPSVETNSRVTTGVAGLDEILLGGLPRGHMFLVEGEPGTGKTTLGLQFLIEGVRHGEQVMYVTLSETKGELETVARSHNWSIDGLSFYEFSPHGEMLKPEYQYSAFHPSEIELYDTTENFLEQLEKLQPARVVIDSLSQVRLLARDSLRYRRQILSLKSFFAVRNCTPMLLEERSTEPAERHALESIVHGVIVLEKTENQFKRVKRRLLVTKLRGSRFREGPHDYIIKTGGLTVFPQLIAAEHRKAEAQDVMSQGATSKGVMSSGIPAVDALCGGGIPRGTSTLVLGPAGSGKSNLTTSFAVAAARRGECAALFAFDESLDRVLRRTEVFAPDVRSHLDARKLLIEEVHPADLSLGQFFSTVQEIVETGDAKVLVLDSLNGFLNTMSGEHLLLLQMHELLSYLSHRGVATFLVLAQTGILGMSMAAPLDISYLADNMLLLRFFESAGQVHKAISAVKVRGSDHEDSIRELRFTPGSITVGEPLTDFHGVLTGVPNYVGSPARLEQASDEPR